MLIEVALDGVLGVLAILPDVSLLKKSGCMPATAGFSSFTSCDILCSTWGGVRTFAVGFFKVGVKPRAVSLPPCSTTKAFGDKWQIGDFSALYFLRVDILTAGTQNHECLSRPRMYRYPSASIWQISPVLIHPSRKADSVASSFCNILIITLSPLTHSTPGVG